LILIAGGVLPVENAGIGMGAVVVMRAWRKVAWWMAVC
jgi:hypothetical protein